MPEEVEEVEGIGLTDLATEPSWQYGGVEDQDEVSGYPALRWQSLVKKVDIEIFIRRLPDKESRVPSTQKTVPSTKNRKPDIYV